MPLEDVQSPLHKPPSNLSMADALLGAGHKQAAIEHFEQAKSLLDHDHVIVRNNLLLGAAPIAFRLGDLALARQYAEAAVEIAAPRGYRYMLRRAAEVLAEIDAAEAHNAD